MSRDLRVAIRIAADGRSARQAMRQTTTELKQLGRDGLRAVRTEAGQAGSALTKLGSAGDRAGRVTRDQLREAATRGARPLRTEAQQVESALRRLAQSGVGGLDRLRRTTRAIRGEFQHLKGALGSAQGRMAALGVGVGGGYLVGQQVKQSAQMDRALLRTRQTAGMTREQSADWREELFKMGREQGNSVAEMQRAGDTLMAGGQSYGAAKATTHAINTATTVTGADSGVLAEATIAAASSYGFDLEQAGVAASMLDKMTVAGREGRAELENLADIFARIGPNAKRAGAGFEQSLGLVETLSLLEGNPERLATLTDSTLRLWTNDKYMQQAQKATGVKFYDAKGDRRDMTDVLSDMKAKYDRLTTDRQRQRFVAKAFGTADLDTQKGMMQMLGGDSLSKLKDITGKIQTADGTLERDKGEHLDSATATAGRMRNTLQQAMDRMSQPINKAFADAGSFLLDELNLSGEQMLMAGAGAAVGGYALGRVGGAALGRLGNVVTGGVGTLQQIAVGKTLQDATGVTSVYVTNWPQGMGSGSGLSELPGKERPGKPGSGRMSRLAQGLRSAWPALLRWGGRLSGPALALSLGGDRSPQADKANALKHAASRGDRRAATELAGIQLRNRWWAGTPSQAQIAAHAAQLMGTPQEQARYRRDDSLRARLHGAPTRPPQTLQGWAAGAVAQVPQGRDKTSADAVMTASRMLEQTQRRLDATLSKPLQVRVSTDTPWLMAEVGRSVERDARRAP